MTDRTKDAHAKLVRNADGSLTLPKEVADHFMVTLRNSGVYNAVLAHVLETYTDLLEEIWGHDMGDVSGYGPEVEEWSEKKERTEFRKRFPVLKQLRPWWNTVVEARNRCVAQFPDLPVNTDEFAKACSAIDDYLAKEAGDWMNQSKACQLNRLKRLAHKHADIVCEKSAD